MSSRLRVLTWNLNAFTSNRDDCKLDLMERLDWDVATLQELTPATIRRMKDRFPDWRLLSRDPESGTQNSGRRLRAGVVVRSSVAFSNELIIDCSGDQGVPGPEREVPQELFAAAEVLIGSTPIAIASAHPPHAAATDDTERAWRIARKLRTYAALSGWAAATSNVIVGMDANAWVDMHPYGPFPFDEANPQDAINRFFHERDPAHGLHDALRSWLDAHPEELEDIRQRRPSGPLALTYVRGGNRPVADRFDVFMVSPHMCVDAIEHNYEDAVAAGSDHAYVLAQFSIAATDR